MPPRLRVVALDEAEALGRTVRWNTLAYDGHEVSVLVFPMPQVAAIDADCDRLWGRRQAGTLPWTAVERKGRLRAELRSQAAGDPQRVPTN